MDSNISMGCYDPSLQIGLINADVDITNGNSMSPVQGTGESTTIKSLLNCRKFYNAQGRFKSQEWESYSKRAIESLIKKIKDHKGNLDNLVKTITIYKSSDTPCICIGRTLDGRLQVAGKKAFPHVRDILRIKNMEMARSSKK
ncbi:hypothetical protein MXB_4180 [Myxobolus squamalis]|nr:hypothetical protein MXB_4180 [Myxobolus squamalis]